MVFHHRRQEIMGGADGMDVSGKVEVDIIHRENLRVTGTARPTLDPKDRPDGGFPKRQDHPFSLTPHRFGQPNGGGGFSLSGLGRGHGGDQDQLAVGTAFDSGKCF